MHDYMMMHDAIFYFLYAMMNVPLYNVISHLVCYTIEVSVNMCECNGFKISNQLFSAQELSNDKDHVIDSSCSTGRQEVGILRRHQGDKYSTGGKQPRYQKHHHIYPGCW